MRLLFTLDAKDYTRAETVFSRPSVRGIILSGATVAMVHSIKFDYYKLPGGGVEPGEDRADALMREVAEETGLTVVPGSIRPYGWVHRIQKGKREDLFLQDNYHYFCSTDGRRQAQRLEDYEAEERFTLEYVDPAQTIRANRAGAHGDKDPVMIEREARILELLIEEGFFPARA